MIVLIVLGGRLVQLQGLQATRVDTVTGVPVDYAELAERQRKTSTRLPAARGQITDRTGQALAMTVQARAVYGEPRVIRKSCPSAPAKPAPRCSARQIAAALAPVLRQDVSTLLAKLTSDKGQVYLAHGLEPSVGTAVRQLRLVGIGVEPQARRVHPAGDLAASVVGFTNPAGTGLAGIEYAHDSVLRGTDGRRTAEVDKAGRVIPTGVNTIDEPIAGRTVQLTLDRDLQWYAQQLVADKVAEVGAENGSAVVLDTRTGEVLALATAPGFDPDRRSDLPASALRNSAVQDVYEPGSVAKVITAAAALEAGVTTPERVQTVPDTIRVLDETFHDSEKHAVQRLTFAGVIATSSNVGTIQVAQELGPQRLHDAFRAWGIGEKSEVGLPGEQAGRLPPVAEWSGSSLPTIAIGQGVSANAVQVATVYATVANGGTRITPSIVKSITDASGVAQPEPQPKTRRVISERVAGQLSQMLENVVTQEGTGTLAAVDGYRVAGKTGTAQVAVAGGYSGYSSSFVGFAPADAPRLVTAVVVQGTSNKRAYYGGAVAGPVFRDIMTFALGSRLGVPPTGTSPARLRLTADGAK